MHEHADAAVRCDGPRGRAAPCRVAAAAAFGEVVHGHRIGREGAQAGGLAAHDLRLDLVAIGRAGIVPTASRPMARNHGYVHVLTP